ncbi:MAG: right-handed parallel beta-helix repeat-containing protein, partial [Pseudomonadales bacterium]|nr:right-handed parallel beta-helix repeat-containing protein [Pseudomonadales bacterium]
MSKPIRIAVVLLFTTLISASGKELYVSPDGDDGNDGTASAPLRTFKAAQLRARADEAADIIFRRGVYYLPETIVLTVEDSHRNFSAFRGEPVVISGGQRLMLSWQSYRDGVFQANTPPGTEMDQLFVNGQLQHMARYPNFDSTARPYNGAAADAFSPQRAAAWANPRGGYVHAMHRAHWGGYHYLITGKNELGEVTYEGGWQNNRQMGMHPNDRMVENIFEELDAPGEWYHDNATSTLYFYPPEGMDLAHASIETVRLRHLIEIRGDRDDPVRGVNLQGFVMKHASRSFMEVKEPLLRSDWTIYRGGAVLFHGTEDCTVANCEFDQLGGNAIFVDKFNRRVGIKSCDIHDTGASAIAFVGDPTSVRNPLFEYNQRQSYQQIDKTPGPKDENFPADCTVEDCLIRHVGGTEKQATGIQISMSKLITVRHCSIYDASRAGINISEGTFGGHLIEHCDVFDTVRETGDHGSFNSWGRDRFWGLQDA